MRWFLYYLPRRYRWGCTHLSQSRTLPLIYILQTLLELPLAYNESPENRLKFKYENSILQLLVTTANYNVKKPFSTPNTGFAKGSGFFIDAPRGLVLTNAHVVNNIISVKCLSPNIDRDIRARLISICKEKDLSIIQIFREDLELLANGKNLSTMSLPFQDTLNTPQMTEVVAVGYPLGQDNLYDFIFSREPVMTHESPSQIRCVFVI